MTRHILLVHSDPVDNRDDEYNSWYDDVHLPDVLKVPGFVAAKRYVAAAGIHGEQPSNRFLAIYEIETDDLPAALRALSNAAKGMHLSSAFDRKSQSTFAFTELIRD
ncbi:hypothetical protein [Rhodococcus jostii]|uniref:hypothetical protein n=1 Tax=Rhodococcus jostii TaxID=132919 RepID=UPI00366A2E90